MRQTLKKLLNFLLILLLITSIIVLTGSLYLSYKSEGKITFTKEVPKQGELFKNYAYISGEVKNPGVYEITEQTRIIDLVNLAGGFTENVDPNFLNSDLNLSALVKNEDHVFIKAKGNTNQEVAIQSSLTELVNINTASMADLMELPGVGESTAQKIIDARPFATIEGLLDVPGIGESKFNQMKDLISVE